MRVRGFRSVLRKRKPPHPNPLPKGEGIRRRRLARKRMSLLVTGSIGIDTIETPAGKRDDVVGGSAIYFSYAASFFTPVRLVGVVGEDHPRNLLKVFEGRDVDT